MLRWLNILFFSVLLTLIHWAVYTGQIGEKIEFALSDYWFALRGPVRPPEEILLVTLDEDSYQYLDVPLNQAWPRSLHAELLESLAEAGVKRVVFDIYFADESTDPEADAALQEALTKVPTVIAANETNFVGQKGGTTLLIPELFKEHATQIALGSFPEDYGTVRRFKTGRTAPGAENLPTIAEAAAGIQLGIDEVPGRRDLISFYGPAGTMHNLPFFEALDPEIAADLAKGKVVFVGLAFTMGMGAERKDSFLTPYPRIERSGGTKESKRTFGVEIHATSAANLMNKSWIKRHSQDSEIWYLSLLCLLVSTIFFLLKPQWGALVLIGTVVGWAYFSYTSFLAGEFIPGLSLNALILPVAFLTSTLYFYYVTYRKQRQTQKAFALYLSPDMAKEVGRNPESLHLGGQNLHCTALFTDIIEFTNISEKMTADEVSEMLNAYFTEVMDVVFRNDGTLLKFIGDSIFAIWGAPIEREDHAERALKSAIKIRDAVEEFNASGRFPPLDTRIGVHTGSMVVGNLGSVKRFDYTAIGDSVNLASRVEGLNNYFSTSLLFTGATRKELKEPFRGCLIGQVAVKGKQETVEINTILPDSVSEREEAVWLAALQHFGAREWEEAQGFFEVLKQGKGFLSGAAEYYMKHLAVLRNQELPEGWSGELHFATK